MPSDDTPEPDNSVTDPDQTEYEKLSDYESLCERSADLRAAILCALMPTRERALAMTKLDECLMWAKRALSEQNDHDRVPAPVNEEPAG